jgi:hypothetical protein
MPFRQQNGAKNVKPLIRQVMPWLSQLNPREFNERYIQNSGSHGITTQSWVVTCFEMVSAHNSGVNKDFA